MASDEPKSRPEIKVDEDWKERVKSESIELDRQAKQSPPRANEEQAAETGKQAAAADVDPSQLPPADFSTLVIMLSTQAVAALGLFEDEQGGEATPQPALARQFIDLLGVLEEKTKGNLTAQENGLLANTLYQIRLAYVDQTKPGPAAQKA